VNRQMLVLVAALVLLEGSFLAVTARAQNGSAQPAKAPSSAPAPSPAPDAAIGTAPTTAPTTPVKKVWTNEDMGAVHSNSAISTFSGGDNKPANAKPVAAKPNSKSAKQYQTQIANLQAKLPPLDAQISELQAGLSGATVNSTRPYNGVKLDDWRDQLARLQKQREDIAAQISALQDEARHSGVPDNQIP
jgi:peptidoglycan hydrolase CwlO-like protein